MANVTLDNAAIELDVIVVVICLIVPALLQVLDVVLSRLLQAEPRPSVVEGLQLLQRCVGCTPAAPLLLSLLLSLISALFVFLSCAYSQMAGGYKPALYCDRVKWMVEGVGTSVFRTFRSRSG